VVVGDVNGDGAPDVVARARPRDRYSCSWATARAASVRESPFTVGAGPRALVAAFLDANGTLDLAVANSLTNNVTILSGNGNGTSSHRDAGRRIGPWASRPPTSTPTAGRTWSPPTTARARFP
jgi:hypothetical protein